MEEECPESVGLRAAVQDQSFLRTLASIGELLGPRPREALCETLQYNDLCDFFEPGERVGLCVGRCRRRVRARALRQRPGRLRGLQVELVEVVLAR